MQQEFPFSDLYDRNSKSDLIQKFDIAKSSFYELVNLSQWLSDFEDDYPSTNNAPIKRAKLSKYQAWVIYFLNQYRVNFGIPLKQLRNLLVNQSELSVALSKETFLQQYS